MVKEGFPFVGITLLISLIFAFFGLWIGVVIFGFLTVFMAYFFRNPPFLNGYHQFWRQGRVFIAIQKKMATVTNNKLMPFSFFNIKPLLSGLGCHRQYLKAILYQSLLHTAMCQSLLTAPTNAL